MIDINKLAEVLGKESGNIQVRCMSEREIMETAPDFTHSYNLLNPYFYNEKIANDWNEQSPNITSYSDILRFVDEHKPSFFGKNRYCRPGVYSISYEGFHERIERAQKEYLDWCKEFSPIANQFKEELNKQTMRDVRLTDNKEFYFSGRLEILTTNEDGLINPITVEISDILFSTQNKEVLIRLFPQPFYGSDARCDIQLPAEYYKFLNWEE